MLQTRIIQLDTLGTIAEVIFNQMQSSPLKQTRKHAFQDMVKLIKLSKLIPEPAKYIAISQGCDEKGNRIILVYFAYEPVRDTSRPASDSANLNPRPADAHDGSWVTHK